MQEFVPLLIGVALGLVAHTRGLRAWSPAVAALAVPLGFLAALVAGELAISWLFGLFDAAQTWAAAAAAIVLASAVTHRRVT